ncbi:hypothetical protein QBC46DRAFT_383325 [Diplogelasinospora grovesii]|uniref:Uncharacterized protein n=1 Tax=Diplogelasinospora grovesii TaxID=303347 RepID=A0AAN6NAF0_9PEZI|nr:hypothetical protein QBC46DRAFT_383325 [Diplogelasinospora grovesii]
MKLLLANFHRIRRGTNLQFQPCIRVSVLDLRLHRRGPTIYNDLHVWVSRESRSFYNIKITILLR